MKTLDTYIQRISKLGIIISLLYYEKNKHVLYVIIELVRSLLDFITGKYIDLVNVILIIYYFSLFVYFLNEKEYTYSIWNGYATVAYFIYGFVNFFVYEKKTYIDGVLSDNHPLLVPRTHSGYLKRGRRSRKLNTVPKNPTSSVGQ
tara:strand:+ start:106 stop:543 length:438 start_codon:yes stop_codon:yes gene_type:complete